ncbi:MAG: AGE family epimerase/isomerase [Georgenia sp.]
MLTDPTPAWLDAEGDALLDFARGSRTPVGFGNLDDAGVVTDPDSAELWTTCRMTHVFALGAMRGRAGCAELVDHGLRALREVFADPEHGGWFAAVGRADEAGARKEAYPHAFVLLAASSATAAGRPGAAELLAEALALHTDRFWDEQAGMVVEGWDRAFTTAEAYRGVNANMHTVEAYLAVADVTGDEMWLDRALRITRRVVDGFAREHAWHIPEHFDADWQPLLDYNRDTPAHPFRPFGATVGHWFEWARLTLHLRAALLARGRVAEPWMLEAARTLFATAVHEGWAVDGGDGFVYTVDFDGVPVVTQRMHWVVCEAIGAAAALYAVADDEPTDGATTREEIARWYATSWAYARRYLIEAPGRWYHEVDPLGLPAAGTWAGRPDVYHAYQATVLPRLPLAPALSTAVARGLLAA